MTPSRTELKVGLFVLICLALLGALLIQFSKGNTFFHKTYIIILKANNVGGLRPRASVLMSGVQVGTISEIKLAPEGTNVSIFLKIYNQYIVRDDARFAIEQSGFLGDQYVAIYPGKNEGTPLQPPNNVAHAQEPFNLQEAVHSADGFLKRMDATAKKLDDAISDVRRLVLNEKTLTNLAFTVGTLRQVSEDALITVDNVNLLIKSNGVPVAIAMSNLVSFSDRLIVVAESAQGILHTNEPQINGAISNLQVSTATLTNLLAEVESGKGLVGSLLKNEQLANNINGIANNLAVTTSNLNRLGLWHFIWYHPKPAETNQTAPPREFPGRNPLK